VRAQRRVDRVRDAHPRWLADRVVDMIRYSEKEIGNRP
jgi:hypothetical protein